MDLTYYLDMSLVRKKLIRQPKNIIITSVRIIQARTRPNPNPIQSKARPKTKTKTRDYHPWLIPKSQSLAVSCVPKMRISEALARNRGLYLAMVETGGVAVCTLMVNAGVAGKCVSIH